MTVDGVPAYREVPIDFNAPNMRVWAPPSEEAARRSLRALEFGRTGQITDGRHRCSAWWQRASIKAGVPGVWLGMGNANQVNLSKGGWKVRKPGEPIRPGDVVQYLGGYGHSREGHIGIALGGGEAKSYYPQHPTGSKPADSNFRRMNPGVLATRKPMLVPEEDPLDELLRIRALDSHDGVWEAIKASRPPGLSMPERNLLMMASARIPQITTLLKLIDTGQFPEGP